MVPGTPFRLFVLRKLQVRSFDDGDSWQDFKTRHRETLNAS
jgi:hypothetical protein